MVVLVLHTRDECARLVLDELERARAIDVLLVPLQAIRRQVLISVDEVERRRHRGKVSARRELQLHLVGVAVHDTVALHHCVECLARRRDAFGRIDDLLVSRMDVIGVQRLAVVEGHALTDLVGVCQTVFRDFPAFASVAFEVVFRRIVRIDTDQQAVERRDRVDHAKRRLDVRVIRRDLRADDELQRSARYGRLGQCASGECGQGRRADSGFPEFGAHEGTSL